MTNSGQLNLFGEDPSTDAVRPADVSQEWREVAERLPAGVYLGTSSWSFPGWAGLIYRDPLSTGRLARDGLAAYAKHPLMRVVGIDRTYYAPISAEDFAAYANATPDAFRFMTKAHNAVTQPRVRERDEYGGTIWRENPHYLDPQYATDEVITPMRRGLGHRVGPLVFQFEPMAPAMIGGPRTWLDGLRRFLEALPRETLYAVEIRNAELLTAGYAETLSRLGAAHCYTVHPAMPPIARQIAICPVGDFPASVARWNLRRNLDYAGAQRKYDPFDRIVDADDTTRDELAGLCLESLRLAVPVYCTVNNKAEGSSPLSVARLARAIADRLPQ